MLEVVEEIAVGPSFQLMATNSSVAEGALGLCKRWVLHRSALNLRGFTPVTHESPMSHH